MYQPDEEVRLEVRMEDETVWLTQAQMAELFNSSKQNISLHISNIYKEGELSQNSTVKEYFFAKFNCQGILDSSKRRETHCQT